MEGVVMQYLACEGRFLSPQFSVRSEDEGEWSCPDFVALNFADKRVEVVEVSTAWNVRGLVAKVAGRDEMWFARIRPELTRRGIIDDSWCFVARVFVRQDRVGEFKQLSEKEDVRVHALEEIAFSWKWPWKEWSRPTA